MPVTRIVTGTAAVIVVLWVAVAFADFPGEQTPGPRLAEDPDQLTWTTSQHVWSLVHQFADALVSVLALAIAGAGGALWRRKRDRITQAERIPRSGP
jgi:hypothetical protein